MLSANSQHAIRKYISSQQSINCLKSCRKALSWLRDTHTRAKGIQFFRAKVESILAEDVFQSLVLGDVRLDLDRGDDLATLKQLYEESCGQEYGWIVIWLTIREFSENHKPLKKNSPESISLAKIESFVSSRTSTLSEQEDARESEKQYMKTSCYRPSAVSGYLRNARAMLSERGKVNIQSLTHAISLVLDDPSLALVSQTFIIMIELSRRFQTHQSLAMIDASPSFKLSEFDEQIVELSRVLLDLSPKTHDLALALSTLARMNLIEAPIHEISSLLSEHRSRANSQSLSTSLWALAKLEAERDLARSLAKELVHILSFESASLHPNKISTMSSLWSIGVFNLEKYLAKSLLSRTKIFFESGDLGGYDIIRCFRASLFFEEDLKYWLDLFKQLPEGISHNYSDSHCLNISEERLLNIISSFFCRYLPETNISANCDFIGFECDLLLRLPNGQMINVEYDGPYHVSHKGSDHFRDVVLEKLGVAVFRFNYNDLQTLIETVPEHANDMLMSFFQSFIMTQPRPYPTTPQQPEDPLR